MQVHVNRGERADSRVFSHNGYLYHVNRSSPGEIYPKVLYMRCANYRNRLRCCGTARLLIFHGHRIWTEQQNHVRACHADPLARRARHLRNKVIDEVRNGLYERPRTLFNRVTRGHDPAVVARVVPHRIRFAMRRARLENYPNIPQTFDALCDLLNDPQYAHLVAAQGGDDSIFSATVGQPGHRSIVFVSRRIGRFMGAVKFVFADATYASTPARPRAAQLYQIVTVVRNTVIPLVTAVMEDKSRQAYTDILRHLRLVAPRFRPRTVMADFEVAASSAWLDVYGCDVVGCFVHFIRANLKKLGELGLKTPLRRLAWVKTLFNCLMALPLLPANMIRRGTLVVLRCFRNYSRRTFEMFVPYFGYFIRTWLALRNLQKLSVYRQPHRTNNPCESAHMMLRHATGHSHPSCWVLLGALQTYEFNAYTDVIAHREGLQMSAARRVSAILNDRMIQNHSQDLMDGVTSIKRFLLRVSATVQDFVDENL